MPLFRSPPGRGRSSIPLTLVVYIVGFVAVTGLYVWSGQVTESPAAAQTAAPAEQSQEMEAVVVHIYIPEWSVRVQMRESEKVEYQHIPNPQKIAQRQNGAVPESSVVFKIKPEYLKNKACNPNFNLSRFSEFATTSAESKPARIGDFYYTGSISSTAECGNAADNSLVERVRQDFSKLEAL